MSSIIFSNFFLDYPYLSCFLYMLLLNKWYPRKVWGFLLLPSSISRNYMEKLTLVYERSRWWLLSQKMVWWSLYMSSPTNLILWATNNRRSWMKKYFFQFNLAFPKRLCRSLFVRPLLQIFAWIFLSLCIIKILANKLYIQEHLYALRMFEDFSN